MRLRLRSRPGWLWAAVLSGLLLHGGSAVAESRITSVKRTWSQEHGPPGAQCAWLETGLYAPERRGDIADLPRGSLIAGLLCPACLDEPRYGVETPLRQIEQQIPPPAEDEARFDCTEHCPRWLLRQGDAALLFVHVAAASLCGVTGYCPGQVYERSAGHWKRIAEYGSGEAVELCIARPFDDGVRLWLTAVDAGGDTALRIDWRP